MGVGMRTLLPGYRVVMAAQGHDAPVVMELGDLFGGPARIRRARWGKRRFISLMRRIFSTATAAPIWGPTARTGPTIRSAFAALDKAAAIIARDGIEGWRPQILHLHDWQAGLAPVYLRQLGVFRASNAC
jgi:starch synthase